MSAPSQSDSLESWFAVWHPLYRPKLLQLGVYAISTGIIVYLEAVALREFSNAFALSDKLCPRAPAILGDPALRIFVAAAESTAIRLPLFILATFAVLRVGRVALEVAGRISGATLSQRARADLEATILDHLLRKDDAFFASRPPAEILNRLSSDIGRVVDRRNLRNQQRQAIFLIAGNIYFFLREDWKLALAGMATCGVGAWTMHRLTQPVKEMDKAYLGHDDRVKAMFEDFLRASAEAQVADLRAPIRARFEIAQDARRVLFLKYSWLREKLTMVSSASYLLAFVALCTIPIYFVEADAPNLQIALVPVILKVLPELFTNASQLVMQRLNLQLADTSEKRLLEYDAGALDAPASDAAIDLAVTVPLVVEDATFRYRSAEGGLHGGVVGITTTFPAQRWTAIVGAAGSGKSTLLQLIVGRTKPERGSVAYGDARYDTLSAAERARFLTLMPQSLAILDATIAENLSFGRTTGIDAEDLALIERTGLAAICQLKALTMHPGEDLPLGRNIGPLRTKIRERLAAEGFVVTPFEKGGRDPDDTVIERLASSRADRTRVVGKLFAPEARRDLDALLATPLGRALADRAPTLLEDTRALLGLSSFAAYAKLAPIAIEEAVWQKRVAVIGHRDAKTRTKAELREMLLVALTAKVHEIGELPAGDPAPFRAILADVSVPLVADTLHPHLIWRDNLVFGRADAPNARAEGRIDRVILETLAAEGHADDMVRVGLAFQVGRGGTRLSGGQRQIIALTRALLRRTPVLVLDEPTSALDPSSRARVASLLKDWAAERIVITVSHDPDLVRCAQQVRVLDAGRLAAAGTFTELEADASGGGAAFRNILRL